MSLDECGRFNNPGTQDGNWNWRYTHNDLEKIKNREPRLPERNFRSLWKNLRWQKVHKKISIQSSVLNQFERISRSIDSSIETACSKFLCIGIEKTKVKSQQIINNSSRNRFTYPVHCKQHN